MVSILYLAPLHQAVVVAVVSLTAQHKMAVQAVAVPITLQVVQEQQAATMAAQDHQQLVDFLKAVVVAVPAQLAQMHHFNYKLVAQVVMVLAHHILVHQLLMLVVVGVAAIVVQQEQQVAQAELAEAEQVQEQVMDLMELLISALVAVELHLVLQAQAATAVQVLSLFAMQTHSQH